MAFFLHGRTSVRNLAISCLLLLSSCISLPKDEQQKNLLSAPSIQPSIEKSSKSPYFSVGDWPKQQWWEIFQARELSELIQIALSQNPSIQAIERRIEFAKQTSKVVRSRLFPLLFFNAEESWEFLSKHGLYRALNPKIPLNANLVDLTLSFSYEFDFWGKNTHLFHAAIGERKAQEAETAQVELITTTAVAQTYFAFKTNLLRKHLLEELVSVRQNIFALETDLQEKALYSKLPPLLSEENLSDAQKQLLGIEDEIVTNVHLLNILLGRGPDTPLNIDESLPSLPKTLVIPENLFVDLLSRRPDLMAQIWRVEALAHDVGAAKADFYPNINLTAFAGLESTLYRTLLQSSSKTDGLRPAIHLPIFTAGAIRANVRAKKASFDEAVYEYNQLLLKSAQEVADLLDLAQTIFEQKERQESIVNNAKMRWELTNLRQQKGLDNLLALYSIQEELIQKKLEDITLLYSEYLATVRLIKALGGGYQSEYTLPLTAQGEGA